MTALENLSSGRGSKRLDPIDISEPRPSSSRRRILLSDGSFARSGQRLPHNEERRSNASTNRMLDEASQATVNPTFDQMHMRRSSADAETGASHLAHDTTFTHLLRDCNFDAVHYTVGQEAIALRRRGLALADGYNGNRSIRKNVKKAKGHLSLPLCPRAHLVACTSAEPLCKRRAAYGSETSTHLIIHLC